MEDMIFLKVLCSNLNLGSLMEVPQKVSEGNYYKTYYVITEKGPYNIKLLLSSLTKNNKFVAFLKQSEEYGQILNDFGINIIKPMEFNGKTLQSVDNQFAYIYPIVNGNVLKPKDVILEQCKTIGNILGKIHNVKLHKIEKKIQPLLHIRWRKYLRLAEHKGSPISQCLYENIKLLEHSTELCNNAINKLPCYEAITHQNLSCNSVIWNGSEFTIINPELTQIANPYIEMINVGLLWAGFEDYKVNFNLFNNVINEYFKEMLKPLIDWRIVYDSAYKERLLLIEDQIKKALLIDCNDLDEQKKSENKLDESIRNIAYFANIEEEILKRLN